MERHFDTWDYQAVQELEALCRTLPILSRERASAFFNAAKKATSGDGDPVERQVGKVFDSLVGAVSASDRKDFYARWDPETQNVARGVLMVETYDDVIGTLFCVARVSEHSFLTRGFTQRVKEAVKRLRVKGLADIDSQTSSPASSQTPTPPTEPSTNYVETLGESLEAARKELRGTLAPGHVVIGETILDDGTPKTVGAEATSVDEAFQKAKASVPANATIENDEVLRQPIHETMEVVALDESEARRKADVRHPRTIQSVTITHAGGRGFLGIGRRPSAFAVAVVQLAKVAVTYRGLVSIRTMTATADMIPSLKSTLWEGGGPIRCEALSREQRSALLGLSAFAAAGDSTAAAATGSMVTEAIQTLLDIREFSTNHGYQRQQVAADILGLVGGSQCMSVLENAVRLQGTHAGCSQFSNTEYTRPLVEAAIHEAIANIRRLAGGA